MTAVRTDFGKLKDGREAHLYTLKSKGGLTVSLTDYGATIVSAVIADKAGNSRDVILGYDDVAGYEAGTCYFGAVIGRSGNRIKNGRFTIGGKTYQLAINNNDNNLHSGPNGFNSRLWEAKVPEGENAVVFSLKDADGEQGYPGNFEVTVTYTLDDDNTLSITYVSTSDADTVSNLTNHVYFNLNGEGNGTIENHIMHLTAERYTPVVDHQAIPTGEIASVKGTPMDFTSPKEIGKEINADFDQLKFLGGYDHNYVIRDEKGSLEKFAECVSPETGICVEAFTDLPGVQFYAGNFLEGVSGKKDSVYVKRGGFCLESQFYPNSINQEGFASPLLKAGEKARTTTAYRFSVKE